MGKDWRAWDLYLAVSAISAPHPGQLCWQLGRFRLQVNSLYAARLASRSACSSGGNSVATAVCVPLVAEEVELAVGEKREISMRLLNHASSEATVLRLLFTLRAHHTSADECHARRMMKGRSLTQQPSS